MNQLKRPDKHQHVFEGAGQLLIQKEVVSETEANFAFVTAPLILSCSVEAEKWIRAYGQLAGYEKWS